MKTYFIATKDRKFVKIGKSVDPSKRIRELQTGHHQPLHIEHVIDGDVEAKLHEKFKLFHTHLEWFEFSVVIKRYIYTLKKKKKRNGSIISKPSRKSISSISKRNK